jgi:glycosyltransferase involved in cell wall biosynthesis
MAGVSVPDDELTSRWHHGSHRKLLTSSTSQPMPVDAIIVPTGREAAAMREALRVAGELGCTLVALCSKSSSAAEVAALPEAEGVRLVAIDADELPHGALPSFRTCGLLAGSRFERKTDTSAKRNFGLLLAKLVGWNKVVFLDDDIVVPDPLDLRVAAGLASEFAGVGMNIEGMPDNSVVCHAYREAGGPQDNFVGGGALAVAVNSTTSFFPNVYNEDWFFLLDEDGLQKTTLIGTAVQEWYDPFGNEDRARREEFGDTLAEGLFWLLDVGRSIRDADAVFWQKFIERRRGFIAEVTAMVQPIDPVERRIRMLESLTAARERSERITPRWCAQYIEAWREDRFVWRRHLQEMFDRHVVRRRKGRKDRDTPEGVRDLLRSLGLSATSFHLRLAPQLLDKNSADLDGPAAAVS